MAATGVVSGAVAAPAPAFDGTLGGVPVTPAPSFSSGATTPADLAVAKKGIDWVKAAKWTVFALGIIGVGAGVAHMVLPGVLPIPAVNGFPIHWVVDGLLVAGGAAASSVALAKLFANQKPKAVPLVTSSDQTFPTPAPAPASATADGLAGV
jgi:hypothetical protein